MTGPATADKSLLASIRGVRIPDYPESQTISGVTVAFTRLDDGVVEAAAQDACAKLNLETHWRDIPWRLTPGVYRFDSAYYTRSHSIIPSDKQHELLAARDIVGRSHERQIRDDVITRLKRTFTIKYSEKRNGDRSGWPAFVSATVKNFGLNKSINQDVAPGVLAEAVVESKRFRDKVNQAVEKSYLEKAKTNVGGKGLAKRTASLVRSSRPASIAAYRIEYCVFRIDERDLRRRYFEDGWSEDEIEPLLSEVHKLGVIGGFGVKVLDSHLELTTKAKKDTTPRLTATPRLLLSGRTLRVDMGWTEGDNTAIGILTFDTAGQVNTASGEIGERFLELAGETLSDPPAGPTGGAQAAARAEFMAKIVAEDDEDSPRAEYMAKIAAEDDEDIDRADSFTYEPAPLPETPDWIAAGEKPGRSGYDSD